MQGSLIAAQIDEEYRKKKNYTNKKKKVHKNDCKNSEICKEKEEINGKIRNR